MHRTSTESEEEGEARLEGLRHSAQQRRMTQTSEDRQERLQFEREAAACRRQEHQAQQLHCRNTKHHCLHEIGWAESDAQLHQQSWAQQEMMAFHHFLNQNCWEHRLCNICHELWPTRTWLSDSQSIFTCTRCKRDKNAIKVFSAANA